LTATARRRVAAAVFDHWEKAAEWRHEWLDVGTATGPADREAAEQILTRMYRRHGRARPRFAWVESPKQGLPLATGIPNHEDLQQWLRPKQPPGRPPLGVDLAAGWSRMMAALDAGASHPDLEASKEVRKGDKPWPALPPVPALEAGVPLRVVLRRHVRDALRTVLMDGVALPARAALGPPAQLPICWYGQQDAYWIGYYDILRRLGLAHYPAPEAGKLDDWATLARSTGWWWPGEEACVMVDRPAQIDRVLISDDATAARAAPVLVYRDGWQPR
jgi:hypothetical protein